MKTTKVSLTLDEKNVAEARAMVGERQFSRLVNQALAHELQRIRIVEWADAADREHGAVPEVVRHEVEAMEWPR